MSGVDLLSSGWDFRIQGFPLAQSFYKALGKNRSYVHMATYRCKIGEISFLNNF